MTDKDSNGISRRGFLKAAGGVTFAVAAYALLPKLPFGGEAEASGEFVEKEINAWVRISADGKITIYNPAAEMGQGSMTALPIIIAEEMDADWYDVTIENSPIEPDIYGSGSPGRLSMITVGSRSVRTHYDSLRLAGASVRKAMIEAGAKKLGVPASDLTTGPSVVIHKKTDNRVSYGELAGTMEVPAMPPKATAADLKDPKDFRLIGNQNVPRFDITAKTDGTAMYAIDVRLPDMAYGMISRSPVNGAKPSLKNGAAVKAMTGVLKVVELDHGIGVIGETVEGALAAKNTLDIGWTGGDAKDHNSETMFEAYAAVASDPAKTGRLLESAGDAVNALKKAVKTYSAEYLNDHAYHAQMEPLNAVVSVSSDGKSAEVWAGSQAPNGARSAVARVLGIAREQVKYNQMYLGGGFGRRSNSDYVEEATALAKTVQRPVKLMWTREDDITYGQFRPGSLQKMEAGVDEKGNVIAWRYTIIGTGGGLLTSGAESAFYDFQNVLVERRDVEAGIRTKHWRAVGHGPNKFAIEAFIDEVAHGEGVDPYQFRRRLMAKQPRALKVLDAAAEMAGWDKPSRKGRAKGIAFAERSGSLCAGVVELSVEEGRIRVHKIWCALDSGQVIQPDNVIAQSEGNILMGLGNVLHESVTIREGKVVETNFDGYNIARMEDTPEQIEIRIIPSTEPPAGVGEAALPFVGGAISNAVFALTGKRLRHIPFTREKVRAELNSSARTAS
jgi:isoquinoline 1-oxidoreductase beta subunit